MRPRRRENVDICTVIYDMVNTPTDKARVESRTYVSTRTSHDIRRAASG